MAIARRFLGFVVLIPALPHSQAPARRVWYTTLGEMSATPDGWVEWRIADPTSIPPHFDEFGGIAARLAPDSVRRWVATVRRAVSDSVSTAAKTAIPSLTSGEAEISLTIHRDSLRVRYEIQAHACRGGRGVDPSRGDVIMLLDALEQAEREAASLRPTPADVGTGPFSASKVTCPARQKRAYMPAWSRQFGSRPADRGESLIRFVVNEDGRIDLSTVEWAMAPTSGPARVAREVLAAWQFEPAMVGARPVRQWSHAVIWFADSSDSEEWQLAGRAHTRTFIARRDGRVEHAYVNRWLDSLWLPNEAVRIREAYAPAVVRAWLGSRSSPEAEEADLIAPGGITRSGSGWYTGCRAFPTTGTGRISAAAWPTLTDSARTAVAAATRHALAPIDSIRVHGETEVTCAARPHGALVAELAHSPNDDEVALSFVVGRDGRTDPESIVLLGELDRREASLLRAALLAQSWEAGRLAGVRVPQHAHLVLHVRDRAEGDLATLSCAEASAVAVRVHVREPAEGIAAADLARIAHTLSRTLGLQGTRSATDGTFTVVLDDVGEAHFFAWKRAPADSAGARAAEIAFRHRRVGVPGGTVVAAVPTAPIAIEADLLPGCP